EDTLTFTLAVSVTLAVPEPQPIAQPDADGDAQPEPDLDGARPRRQRGPLDVERGGQREPEGESGAPADLTVDLQLRSVQAQDLLRQGQAQPRAPGRPGVRVAPPEEPLAEVAEVLGRDARAVVHDRHPGLVAFDP